MATATMQHAQQLWDYMSALRSRDVCDVVVVCCSYDLRVCDYACELINAGLAPRLLLSGNTGNWTQHVWDRPEAEVFAERARATVLTQAPCSLKIRRRTSVRTLRLRGKLLPAVKRAIFITKPNSVLRVSLTTPVQWPGICTFVDSPALRFPDDVSHMIGVLGVIDEMVGDLHRIVAYPRKGFQQPCALPPAIIAAWRALIIQGFTHHLLSGEPLE